MLRKVVVILRPALMPAWCGKRSSVRHRNVKNVTAWGAQMGYFLGYGQHAHRCYSLPSPIRAQMSRMPRTVFPRTKSNTGGERRI